MLQCFEEPVLKGTLLQIPIHTHTNYNKARRLIITIMMTRYCQVILWPERISYLPAFECYWVDHSRLDYFSARKYSPGDCYWLKLVTVCVVCVKLHNKHFRQTNITLNMNFLQLFLLESKKGSMLKP